MLNFLSNIGVLIVISLFSYLLFVNLYDVFAGLLGFEEGFVVTKEMIDEKQAELEKPPQKHGSTPGDSGNYSYLESKLSSVAGKLDSVSDRLAKLEESGEDTLATVEENKMMIDEIMKETQEDAVNLSSIVDEDDLE